MGPQLIHNSINAVHVAGVSLVGGITFGEALVQRIQGRLMITDCRGDCVNGLLAGCGVGFCSGEVDEGRDFIQGDELADMSVIVIFILYRSVVVFHT